IGSLPADTTTPNRHQIVQYLAGRKRSGQAATTIIRHLASIRSWLSWLRQTGRLKEDPSEGIENPQRPRRLPQTLGQVDIEAMIGYCYKRRDIAILELLYGAGLRVSELSQLKLSDVNLSQGHLKCFGKGSKERIVPIGSQAIKALEAYLEERQVHLPAPAP